MILVERIKYCIIPLHFVQKSKFQQNQELSIVSKWTSVNIARNDPWSGTLLDGRDTADSLKLQSLSRYQQVTSLDHMPTVPVMWKPSSQVRSVYEPYRYILHSQWCRDGTITEYKESITITVTNRFFEW